MAAVKREEEEKEDGANLGEMEFEMEGDIDKEESGERRRTAIVRSRGRRRSRILVDLQAYYGDLEWKIGRN